MIYKVLFTFMVGFISSTLFTVGTREQKLANKIGLTVFCICSIGLIVSIIIIIWTKVRA